MKKYNELENAHDLVKKEFEEMRDVSFLGFIVVDVSQLITSTL